MKLGKFGVWQPGYATTPAMAKQIEDLGFTALWLGGPAIDLAGIDELLGETADLVVGTSVYNVNTGNTKALAAAYRRIDTAFPGRLFLGLGVGHREQVTGYATPMTVMRTFLDELDAHGVPRERRGLAALGPKMLAMSRDRSGGAVPYLVTPEHTRRARQILGTDALLAPEQKIVLDSDPDRARKLARPRIRHPYLGLVNYTNNLRRLGFGDDDLAGDGSDRLIDQLALHGDITAIAAGLAAHVAAGADHVQIQVIGDHSVPHPKMPEVLLQHYDESVMQTYAALADGLGLNRSATAH